MKKFLITLVSVMLLSILCTIPVMADNYTGWSTEQDKVVYYVNGIKQTNVWILKGTTLHYLGADGFVDNTQAADISAAPVLGITNYLVADQSTKYDVPMKQDAGDPYSAAKYAFKVANDYEAFQWLYPQYTYTLNDTARYEYYLSTYHRGDTPNKYLQALDGYVDYYTNMCTYGHHYEPNFDKTHKSYCACGKYIIEDCYSANTATGNKKDICKLCGASYHYLLNQRKYERKQKKLQED